MTDEQVTCVLGRHRRRAGNEVPLFGKTADNIHGGIVAVLGHGEASDEIDGEFEPGADWDRERLKGTERGMADCFGS